MPALHSSGAPSVRLRLTLGPRHQQAVENPPTHHPPPPFPQSSVRRVQKHLLALFSGYLPHTQKKKKKNHPGKSQPGRILVSFGLLSGSGCPPFIPRRGCGITREEREDGEGARCCCDGCLCLRNCEQLSRSECFSSLSLFLSPLPHSLPSTPTPPPVYLPLLQLFGFTIQHAAGCTAKAPSLNGQAARKA